MTATQPARNELEIAHAARLKPIQEIAVMMGLGPGDIEPYGSTKAKIKLEVIERNRAKPDAKYIVVTAITPTPLG
ncbi:MAG: formate--tetrahydrofolate ligase, partial [Chloroflexota bacterium]|nr:formate--tetrahydrofolate ligase [Chloroflexota bacterium]